MILNTSVAERETQHIKGINDNDNDDVLHSVSIHFHKNDLFKLDYPP